MRGGSWRRSRSRFEVRGGLVAAPYTTKANYCFMFTAVCII